MMLMTLKLDLVELLCGWLLQLLGSCNLLLRGASCGKLFCVRSVVRKSIPLP